MSYRLSKILLQKYVNIFFLCKTIELVTILTLKLYRNKILSSQKIIKLFFCFPKENYSKSIKRRYSTSSWNETHFQVKSLTFDFENRILDKNHPLEDFTFESFFKEYLKMCLNRMDGATDFDSGKCRFLQLDDVSVLISREKEFLFVSKVDFQYHDISDKNKNTFYSLCVFNNTSITKMESNSIFDVNVTFINYSIDNNLIGEPFYFSPIKEGYNTAEYLSEYLINNEKIFIIRIRKILTLLKKLDLLESNN